MEAKLIKNGNAYSLKINSEYVAFANEDFVCYATQEFRDNLLGKLSLKNCQAIELGYDLDELADECQNILIKDNWRESPSQKIAFTLGFQKALSILGDKKFSEKDVKRLFELGIEHGHRDGYVGLNYTNECIQSLQQTEWEVEIVTKNSRTGKIIKSESDLEWDEDGLCDVEIPKLDEKGKLILKRK